MRKWVYTFGGGAAEGSRAEIEQLGGKGANLAEMAALGLPVPPGLTIVSDACGLYYKNERTLCDDLKTQVLQGIAGTGRRLGTVCSDPPAPIRRACKVSGVDMQVGSARHLDTLAGPEKIVVAEHQLRR